MHSFIYVEQNALTADIDSLTGSLTEEKWQLQSPVTDREMAIKTHAGAAFRFLIFCPLTVTPLESALDRSLEIRYTRTFVTKEIIRALTLPLCARASFVAVLVGGPECYVVGSVF